jgi:hypothetical protein
MRDRIIVWLWKHGRSLALWSTWLLLLIGLGLFFGSALYGRDPVWFLSGRTTHGHYQIEQDCKACHTPFQAVASESCVECHGADLARANDSHPDKKFKDPRNAPLLETLDARSCITCHGEHRQDETFPIGVTQPPDFCAHCHRDIAKDRPSHKDLPFDGCRDCHNYHDNRALYEDFLAKHLDEPATLEPAKARLPARNFREFYREKAETPVEPLTQARQDGPADTAPAVVAEWAASRHAQAGVNCRGCHSRSDRPEWTDKPDPGYCEDCHRDEVKGFLDGRHGLRLARGLAAMTTGEARRPMRTPDRTLTCNACHPAHRHAAEPLAAGVESCLDCHADEHSRAYKRSPHYRLLEKAARGEGDINAGVSCATCHLPRETARQKGKERVKVQHNQNHNLRPNQKMVRDVCLRCHGLGFALDSLADPEVIRHNFSEKPRKHLRSLDMTARRIQNKTPQ